ncbi:MAG: acetyl-CoA carboxylase biotin carboxylase subunit [Myxococcales bacterium]|nr:acetyl-CoA carboxylase biotin carboxylase subunit [Myxococcales bacterium]MDP3505046.1 acetyl-CoA carboxylase biotin carboxylase subunit [Myxococcales bacterium]
MARISKVLVANRGEIAVRVMRTCKELGLKTVAVYSEADRTALHARFADEAICIGPAPSRQSYLVADNILSAAKQTGADAIHPGYGFLSENASFVRACDKAGVTFIGPPASAMDAMGEKTRARSNMMKAGVPVVPGSTEPFKDAQEAHAYAKKIGFPVMLKAAGGGGGKGMRRVDREEDLDAAWRTARSEAMSAFGNDSVYMEKFLDQPHHVEIQVFADTHGNCIHLNERECSAQRRNQKVVEETPSPILTPQMRAAMGEVAVKAAKAVNYVGAGTVEFLVDSSRNFYFLEMNTRLQVEHPVTEWVMGVDLVAWQLHVAQGGVLPMLEPMPPRGHSIEVRVYAEDPATNFMPSPGKIEALRVPSGPFMRDDSGVYAGYTVPNTYDPMISKLSVWAPTRAEAIARMRRALDEYVVKGITTNIAYLKGILAHAEFQRGDYDTGFLGRAHQTLLGEAKPDLTRLSMIAAAIRAHQRAEARAHQGAGATGPVAATSGWRTSGRRAASWKRS